MKKSVQLIVFLFTLSYFVSNSFAQKQKVFLNTDLGDDFDDANALTIEC